MYSFRQRSDTTVVDEPLYAHYLRVSGRDHPGRDEVLASLDPDGNRVVADVILGSHSTPVVFFKQMAHHLVEVDRAFLGRCRNILLTRDPGDMLPSLAVQLPDAAVADTGLLEQVQLLEAVLSAGETPIVLDSHRLLADPPAVLGELCTRLGLEFEPAMLSWPAGPKPEDGVWAQHWYENVHRSTGFEPYRPKRDMLPDRLAGVLAEAVPLYERLAEFAIGGP
jgi:hypothetical protein